MTAKLTNADEHVPLWAYCVGAGLIEAGGAWLGWRLFGGSGNGWTWGLLGAAFGMLTGIPLYWLEVRFGRIPRRAPPS